MDPITGFVVVSCVVFGVVSIGQLLDVVPIDKKIDNMIPNVRKPFN